MQNAGFGLAIIQKRKTKRRHSEGGESRPKNPLLGEGVKS